MEKTNGSPDHDSHGRTDAEARAEFKDRSKSEENRFPDGEAIEANELLNSGYVIVDYNQFTQEGYVTRFEKDGDAKEIVTEYPWPVAVSSTRNSEGVLNIEDQNMQFREGFKDLLPEDHDVIEE